MEVHNLARKGQRIPIGSAQQPVSERVCVAGTPPPELYRGAPLYQVFTAGLTAPAEGAGFPR